MSFSVQSKAAPAIADSLRGPDAQKAQAAREKVIALLQGSKPQSDTSNQAPAEVIQAQADANVSTQALAPSGQDNTSEAQEAAASTSASEAEAPAEKKEAPLSSQYAVLARKEKQLRIKAQQQELAYKAREDALRARETELAQKDSKYQSDFIPKDRLTQDTINVLLEQGITYDQITQMVLNQPQQDPATRSYLQKLEAKIAALEAGVQETKKSSVDQQTQSYNQAVHQIRLDAKSLVKTDPAFETIRETASEEDIVSLIKDTFEKDGILLSVEEAAQTVEEQLVEEAMKIARIKKIQQKLNAAPAQPPKQGTDTKKSNEMKTLTNAVGTARQLTARERAIAAMEGKKI